MVVPLPSESPVPERKPMATARRVSLFHRELRVSLSSAAIELFFELAAVLSEGHAEGDVYFGSTMITFDLARASGQVSDPCDAAAARRVCDELAADPRVLSRARELARREAERIASRALPELAIDVRARASGVHVELDVDVEAHPAAPIPQPPRRAGPRRAPR